MNVAPTLTCPPAVPVPWGYLGGVALPGLLAVPAAGAVAVRAATARRRLPRATCEHSGRRDWEGAGAQQSAQKPKERPMISFMISVVPP